MRFTPPEAAMLRQIDERATMERLERELDALAALRTLATDAAPFDPQPLTPSSA